MKSYTYCVIVPTCMLPHVEDSFVRWIEHAEENTLFLLSINPLDMEQAKDTFEKCKLLEDYCKKRYNVKNVDFEYLWSDGPIGFGPAVNKGCDHIRENYEVTGSIIILNDDVSVMSDWQPNLVGGLYSDEYMTSRTHQDNKTISKDLIPFKIGMAGPMSDKVGGAQLIERPSQYSPEQFAEMVKKEEVNSVILESFISGFCMALTPEFFSEMLEKDGFLFDPIYKVGGFEDNDLCVRALMNGYISVKVGRCWLPHKCSQTIKDMENIYGGLQNHSIFLDRWKSFTQRDQKVIGAYRVSIKNINNLLQFQSSLIRAIPFVDGLSIILTNNPAESLESYDRNMFSSLADRDKKFLKSCLDLKSLKDLQRTMKKWIKQLFLHPQVNKKIPIKVECWDKEFNERNERNRNYEMAVEMGADWVISIDADEIIEDRITPEFFQSLIKHPNPLISAFVFGWLNHYESGSLVRQDRPFSDGYYSGMVGPRLFRIWNKKHLPIFAGTSIGLHCGNSPDYGATSLKIASFRFRHLSMLRHIDRVAKSHMYNALDQEKNKQLLGSNNYHHIKRCENVNVDIYMPNNGIGGFTLGYEEEKPFLLSLRFESYHGICDVKVFNWTGEWEDSDKEWLSIPWSEFPTQEEFSSKYKTGPNWDVAVAGKAFSVDFIHYKFNEEEGLAGCRNAALDRIRELNTGGIHWAFYLDPDEGHHAVPELMSDSCIRRMAESPGVWSFLFNFVNPVRLNTGEMYDSMSQSMRLFTIDPNVNLRFYGVVHETLELSMHDAIKRGHAGNVRVCPNKWINGGLRGSPEQIVAKLTKYQKGLVQLLTDNPLSGAAWTSLGLTYLNDADQRNAELCFERACLSGKGAYLPHQELAFLYMRRAKGLLAKAYNCANNVEALTERYKKIGRFIKDEIGEFPRVFTKGVCVSEQFELPSFPYDIVLNGNGDLDVEGEEEDTGEKES